jgi:Fe2+ transport system protein FeoA
MEARDDRTAASGHSSLSSMRETSWTAHMSASRPTLTLDRLPSGTGAVVRSVGVEHAGELLRDGLLPGAPVRVRSRAPLRGPVIVEIGGPGATATVAISRSIARVIEVRPVAEDRA